MLIEIHCIQSLPVAHINRGLDNQPKTVLYGGVIRGRVSSQAQKYSIRIYIQELGLLEDTDLAYRTRHFTDLVAERLEALGIDKAKAANLAVRAMAALKLGHKEKKSADDATLNEFMIFFSNHELAQFSEAIYTHRAKIAAVDMDVYKESESESKTPDSASTETAPQKKKPKKTKAQIKTEINKQFPFEVIQALQAPFIEKHALEVAMFGRQLTNFAAGTVDGQVQIAHAISVDRSATAQDLFTAIDDFAFSGKSKSGMIKSRGFNAPTLYRVAAINISQLAREVGSVEAAKRGAAAFLEAFVSTIAEGGQRAFLSRTIPSFVLLQCVEKGHALSYSPAFLKPVQSTNELSTVEAAIVQMARHVEYIETAIPRIKRTNKVFFSETPQEFKGAKRVIGIEQAIKHVLDKFKDQP